MKSTALRRWMGGLLLLASAGVSAGPTPLADRLLAIDEAARAMPLAARVQRLQAAYQADPLASMLAEGCQAVPAERVEDAFAATQLVNFYAPDAQRLEQMQCLLPRLRGQGDAAKARADELHRALIAQRRFAQANALRAATGLNAKVLPEITGDAAATRQVLTLTDAGHAIRRTLPQQGWQVVALVHPYCGFSQRALAAITTDPAFAGLRPQLQLVVPNDQSWPIQQMLDWNRAHPDLPMQPLQPGPSWTALRTGQTPTFHLLKDGALMTTALGWENDGQALRALQALIEAPR
ncbi:hypothetical protein [Stenotrophomonas sp.]|uniref:hypothetical protein n=1 Tax=Stenotrophomonas sp. TaxID=69392 RepID=UPI002D229E98|nr:hypothetical protein [Stenotrophomonas sp.]HYQ22665.1 hypothetical protein [Stenotrophomonas sp.]